MKNEKELFIMLEIPVEKLNLFEQLDRNVVAFYRNTEISQTESLNIRSHKNIMIRITKSFSL